MVAIFFNVTDLGCHYVLMQEKESGLPQIRKIAVGSVEYK